MHAGCCCGGDTVRGDNGMTQQHVIFRLLYTLTHHKTQ